MTVDTHTGEIVEFDQAAAERRAERINLRLEAIAENYRTVLPMIRDAIEKRDDMALGYRSVGEYVQDRFGGALANLGVDVRRAVVGELTDAGMSTRAIAPVVGVGASTVKRDVQQVAHVGHLPQTPEPDSEGEADEGSGHTPQGEARDGRPDEAASPCPAVTGIDGKKYSRPEPSKPKRSPLPDSFFRAVYDARKRVESLHRLTKDDRFHQNAEKVAASHRNDLLRISDLLQQVIDSLPTEEDTQ